MFSRGLVVWLALLPAAMVAPGGAGAAAAPEGPRIAVSASAPWIQPEGSIITMDPRGKSLQPALEATGGGLPSWSADGSRLTFGAYGEWSGEVVAVAEESRPGLRFFRRASIEGGKPLMAPDGLTVAYPYDDSIWLLDLTSGSMRQAIPGRLRAYFEPSSFSPDGSKLAGTTWPGGGYGDAVAVDLRTGHVSLLAREAAEPVYSPDGSEVAFIRWKNWRTTWIDDGSQPIEELRVTQVGTFPRSRLLRRSHKLLLRPSWDPSGEQIAFTRTRVIENGYFNPKKGDALMAINADGTCLKKVYSDPETTVYRATWQPGPGREAGPISC